MNMKNNIRCKNTKNTKVKIDLHILIRILIKCGVYLHEI